MMSSPETHDPRSGLRDRQLARRNLFTALALVFVTIPLIPYVQETRIGWFMWRDAPVLALTLTALAAIMVIGALRTRRG
jgi:hypothetical protein